MLPLSVLPALLLSAQPASACGGFFCNQDQPVLQNAERIVFAIDEEEEVVESHVQIFYEGPSEEFAWIVPVPAVPELWVSSDALFDTVARNTAPSFDLEWEDEGVCKERSSRNGGDEAAVFDSVQASSVSTDHRQRGHQRHRHPAGGGLRDGDITGQLVGGAPRVFCSPTATTYPPTSTRCCSRTSSPMPTSWPCAWPRDKDSGDLTPLGMRYPGTEAMVPIQLTSVSATPNMRLEAYVFANERVVPSSYLHVQINDAAMDWWSAGSNYAGVITEAANEAGGHAFATDFAGTPANMKGQLFIEGNLDLDSLRQSADARGLDLRHPAAGLRCHPDAPRRDPQPRRAPPRASTRRTSSTALTATRVGTRSTSTPSSRPPSSTSSSYSRCATPRRCSTTRSSRGSRRRWTPSR